MKYTEEKIIAKAKEILKDLDGKYYFEGCINKATFNFEDEILTEEQILEMLQKSSDEEVKRKLGFWAVQLPKADEDKEPTNKKYIGKK